MIFHLELSLLSELLLFFLCCGGASIVDFSSASFSTEALFIVWAAFFFLCCKDTRSDTNDFPYFIKSSVFLWIFLSIWLKLVHWNHLGLNIKINWDILKPVNRNWQYNSEHYQKTPIRCANKNVLSFSFAQIAYLILQEMFRQYSQLNIISCKQDTTIFKNLVSREFILSSFDIETHIKSLKMEENVY